MILNIYSGEILEGKLRGLISIDWLTQSTAVVQYSICVFKDRPVVRKDCRVSGSTQRKSDCVWRKCKQNVDKEFVWSLNYSIDACSTCLPVKPQANNVKDSTEVLKWDLIAFESLKNDQSYRFFSYFVGDRLELATILLEGGKVRTRILHGIWVAI